MKNIHDYPRVLALLRSPVREDVLVGINLVKKILNKEEILYSFPNSIDYGSPLEGNDVISIWTVIDDIILDVRDYIFSFPIEGNDLVSWRYLYIKNEI